ncbi:hypothetical protein SSMG_04666 [Streptomyces sp. AA4]|nr:hypothetical protein SSMG_04666 [Streptomyces sp. AA4]
MCFAAGAVLPTGILVVPPGFFGLGANPVLISLAVRYAGHAPTLGSSLSVAAFDLGTALASWIGGAALDSGLGTVGPAAVGAVLSALTLVPVLVLAASRRAPPVSSSPR